MIEAIPEWLGNTSAGALVAVIVWLVLTDRLRPAKRADRELEVITDQRDDAVAQVREAHEVNRIYAESVRTLTAATASLADGQDVILHLIRALPKPEDRRDA